MLTKLKIRNFKRFDEAEVELGNPVVFIGPNNSGKTSAMQALALWSIGLKRWRERRRSSTDAPVRRPGVAINRQDLVAIPTPEARLLWRGLHVRDVERDVGGRPATSNVRIDVSVEGVSEGKQWECGLEFDFANSESFYCRPLRLPDGSSMEVPPEAAKVNIAFLPPMSGLAATETRLTSGAVNVRIGEGRTAEVLRNLCYAIYSDTENPGRWNKLTEHIKNLFGADLDHPRDIPERGEISMGYRENGVLLDLSSTGRGLQQTLLLLAYLYANDGAVLLLDEPDAHLEILRQRQIYRLLSETAAERGSQIIVASHSEVLLNEAAGKDLLVAFLGKPHRIDDRGSQVQKALREIGFEYYYQAAQTGWVLYLEGSTDLAILQAFAEKLAHERALRALERPFVYYVGNQPNPANDNYHGLREAVPELKALALFDRLDSPPSDSPGLRMLTWERREIENYLCTQKTLEAYAHATAEQDWPQPLFLPQESSRRLTAMREAISEVTKAMETLGRGSPWSIDAKVSDEFLTPLFDTYYKKLGLPNLMTKTSFHKLVPYVPADEVPPEVASILDAIAAVAEAATPL